MKGKHSDVPVTNPHALEGFVVSSRTRKTPPRTCVAVRIGENVDVRDSKDAKSPTLSFSKEEWGAFVEGVKNGEFDVKP